jgi:hypothetical protein
VNLLDWSDQGELITGSDRMLTNFNQQAFYRLHDLDPSALHGPFFGLIQSEQGESGDLLGRHRLKSRWWLYEPKGTLSKTPAIFFRKLIVHYQFLEDDLVKTLSGPLEDLTTIATPGDARRLTATWTRGSGPTLRKFVLTLDFPYSVNTTRSAVPLPSDPTYTLACTYATAQPKLDPYTKVITSTSSDTTSLVQLAPLDDPSSVSFTNSFTVVDRGARITLGFVEGLPLVQGSPPFIFKTLILNTWIGPSIAAGDALPAFSTDSFFSRTLLPGHHNFFHTALIEPRVDPALSTSTRLALAAANIRYICLFHDPDLQISEDDIFFIGFDNSIRDP